MTKEGQSIKQIVLGMMSGTSLDGLDLALVEFDFFQANEFQFKLLQTKFIPYTDQWRQRLSRAHLLDAESLEILEKEYGHYLGEKARILISESNYDVDFISSHGHTIFHRPEIKQTKQIGCGKTIAETSNHMVINDFRTQDVLMGGQGAPLVPIGDKLLFADYSACINLGGFANISFDEQGERIAFDICPLNIIQNKVVQSIGLEFDEGGEIASKGSIDYSLLAQWNELEYYNASFPKSLGREWVEENIYPAIEAGHSTPDLLRTMTEHSSDQIAKCLNDINASKVLFTGGGTYNRFLMQRVSEKVKSEICIPSAEIIDFKEAIIFAFLGFLRFHNIKNVLSSVTGAPRDHVSGKMWKKPSVK